MLIKFLFDALSFFDAYASPPGPSNICICNYAYIYIYMYGWSLGMVLPIRTSEKVVYTWERLGKGGCGFGLWGGVGRS